MLKDKILEYVTRMNGGVSWVEIAREFSEEFLDDGSVYEVSHNVILWFGATQALHDAINELKSEGKIVLKPASLLAYIADGTVLRLPIAKSLATIKKGYKKPHWLPTVFNLPGQR